MNRREYTYNVYYSYISKMINGYPRQQLNLRHFIKQSVSTGAWYILPFIVAKIANDIRDQEH